MCDVALAGDAVGGPLDAPVRRGFPVMRRSSRCSCSGAAGHVTLIVAPRARAGRWADPARAFGLALAMDSQWLVRVVAQPAADREIDNAALTALADVALARLPGA